MWNWKGDATSQLCYIRGKLNYKRDEMEYKRAVDIKLN